jgi:hypothetical protein
MSRPGSG